MTTPKHTDALPALVEAATPGPWQAHFEEAYYVTGPDLGRVAMMMNLKGAHGLGGRRSGAESAGNARLIAAAPTAIRSLLDELEKARADAERYRWLRDHGEWEAFDTVWLHEQNLYGQGPADMDAAIDQARAAQQGD